MDKELVWGIRAMWGALGGLVAVGSKYVAQDHYWVRVLIDTRQYDHIPGVVFFYVGLLLVLGAIGAVFAVASKENQEMKLLAIAVSAPALITTWLGGSKADASAFSRAFLDIAPISSAWADEANAKRASASPFWKGFVLPLGFGKDDSRYRVVVGSFKDRTQAAQLVEKIKKENPKLTAFVGQPQPNNAYAPVVVGDYLPYPEARQLKDDVSHLEAVKDVNDIYLSPYKFR